MAVTLTAALRAEYQQLFDTCQVRADKAADVEAVVKRMEQGRARYEAVAGQTGVPWSVIAAIHQMECSGRFDQHLHNGDPLTGRTVHVPAGRPTTGAPPFTWEASALDSLTYQGLHKVSDWSVPGTLYQLEKYNGFGYRTRNTGVYSPYLWSYSQHYQRGKFIKDGVFSPTAVSAQIGAAVLLRRLAERQNIALAPLPPHPDITTVDAGPLVRYLPKKETEAGHRLQRFLNQFPDVYLKDDGKLGDKSSEAFQKLTGYYLKGDPRA